MKGMQVMCYNVRKKQLDKTKSIISRTMPTPLNIDGVFFREVYCLVIVLCHRYPMTSYCYHVGKVNALCVFVYTFTLGNPSYQIKLY